MKSTCPICLDEKELISLETCSHGICSTCIIQTLRLKDNCPICRTVWCPEMTKSQPLQHTGDNFENNLQSIWLNSIHRSPYENELYNSLTIILGNNLITNNQTFSHN